jgi:mannose-1-phosphate guanylyltransferase
MTEEHAPTHAVIMAGGSGTRFWPASRRARPKQLLPLAGGDEPLIASTLRRLSGLADPEHTWIVTSELLADATAAATPSLPRSNVLAEPVGRNTAPCVGWAASIIARTDPKAVIAVLPADHHIGDEEGYRAVLARAIAAAREGDVVTVGITPTRPEIGYGYIEVGEEISEGVNRAARFVEKPDRAKAEEYLAQGRFLWNSGMFFFRADVILDAIREHLPELASALADFDAAAAQGREAAVVSERYATLPSISIDHGVMERAKRVAVVPGDFGWSDLGSWTTAWELAERDANDNAGPNDAVFIDADGCYVRAPAGKLVALVGVEGLVVVDTEDALLVVPRGEAQRVRDVVKELRDRGDERL